ncbi:ferredoxin--NADP reductase [Phenylobacterium sp.]|uniref:ferredoxin--NADP reductase n=1 Tax=Phenylobacterium sp. TaxID=1871053 RepID=UPI0028967B00|nr:ferredoxin--NADP reductase [Phenylobacterium sp.]
MTAVTAAPKANAAFNVEHVTHVHHWTDQLFTFRTTRSPALRFQSGQFVMIGLEVAGRPLVRAYSIASPHYAEELEFYSIKVADGPLTSRLQSIQVGDEVLVGRKPTGTLVLDALLPGRTLYLLATGTGLAPFLSLARDPEVYDRFERVVLTHTCRAEADLGYRELLETLHAHPELGEFVGERLSYYPTLTRGAFKTQGRITDLIESGKLARDLDLPPLDPSNDRLMVCGGPPMLADLRALLDARGFAEGSLAEPGAYVYEKAFAG